SGAGTAATARWVRSANRPSRRRWSPGGWSPCRAARSRAASPPRRPKRTSARKDQGIMRRTLITLALGALSLAGCADGIGPVPEATVPASAEGQFVGGGDGPYQLAEPPPFWWRLYEDPVLDNL